VGAKMAFPDLRLDELFYFNSDQASGNVKRNPVSQRQNYVVNRFSGSDRK
jgi:hypothetical protein